MTTLADAVADLRTDDVAGLDDATLRAGVSELLTLVNAVHAALTVRIGEFDRRGLSQRDAQRSTAAWLRAFGRQSAPDASALVRRARLSQRMPVLADAAAAGDVSVAHVERVSRLVERVGIEPVRRVEEPLVAAARQVDPTTLGRICDRVRAHLDPDGPDPDPEVDFRRRGVTFSRLDGMTLIRGQLDPEGAAALMTAVDAFLMPPKAADLLTPAQRRADAMIELARHSLAAGTLPKVGARRPQIAMVMPAALVTRLRAGLADHPEADPQMRPEVDPQVRPEVDPQMRSDSGTQVRPDPGTQASASRLVSEARRSVERAWVDWVGEVPDETARRIACDCEVWRAVLDPGNGQPLDVGRQHRTAPPWMRRALYVRDHGCRFPGCDAPAPWTDAHHLRHWLDGGRTTIENMILLCRYHHVLVHEGGWLIDIDTASGDVTAYRPGGRRYELRC